MADVQRLLVRAPNWLGDAVMALPALEAVRRAFAGRTIILAALFLGETLTLKTAVGCTLIIAGTAVIVWP